MTRTMCSQVLGYHCFLKHGKLITLVSPSELSSNSSFSSEKPNGPGTSLTVRIPSLLPVVMFRIQALERPQIELTSGHSFKM